MAHDEALAERIGDILTQDGVAYEAKRMFGGLAYMVRGNMCVGVIGENAVARVGPQQQATLETEPGARPMDFTGRPMKGWLYVSPDGTETDASLRRWVERSLAFNGTLDQK